MTDGRESADEPSDLVTEITAEQRHLDLVYARLEVVKADVAAVEADGHQRAAIGNEGGLYERDVMVFEATKRLRALDAEYEGLVFGRLDLDNGEVRYIGRLGLRDEKFDPLVIDWRAPAAAAFYQATAEHRMDVVRRRVIRCSGPSVVAVEDDLLAPDLAPADMRVVGDGALLATLARGTGRAMRDIVATIQHEQDQAVRAPAGGVTLITGGPGTGKTAVALHRAAYLLYRDRRRYEGGGVLVIGPSPVFMNYIGQVLPSLGEETVGLRALGELLDGVAATRHDDPPVAAIKGSLRMRDILSRALRESPPGAPTQLRVPYGGEVLRLDAGDLTAVRRRVGRRRAPRNTARAHVVDELVNALWNKAMAWSDRPNWNRGTFSRDVRDRDAFVDFVDAWWPVLTPEQVLGWLTDPARLARSAGRLLTADEADVLARSWAKAEPSVQDVPILDELRVMLGPPPRGGRPRREDDEYEHDQYGELSTVSDRRLAERVRPTRDEHYDEYAHLVVDEAQDLSPLQWRLLGRRGRYASWTIVGDPAQSSWEDRAEANAAMDAALGRLARHVFTLSTNYRNPAEIFDVAARVAKWAMPEAELPRAVRSTGQQPSLRTVAGGMSDAVCAAAAELLGHVEGMVGVITTMDHRDEARRWLAQPDGLPAERVQVVGSLEAKGMEYDGVVIVEPADIAAESSTGVRTLYVALTRATQRLITVATSNDWLPPDGGR